MKKGKASLNLDDLISYEIREPKPLEGKYENLNYFTAPLPSCGLLLIQILNLFEIQRKKIKNINELEFSLILVKALKLAFKDRFSLYGDPKFLETNFETNSKEYFNCRFFISSYSNVSLKKNFFLK